MLVNEITIEPGTTPACPGCGDKNWIIRQRIERETHLVRVDKFADLVVEAPDTLIDEQSVILHCVGCGGLYQPQPGVWGKVESYTEGSQTLNGEGLVEAEKVSGYEDGRGWPAGVQNSSFYEASDEF